MNGTRFTRIGYYDTYVCFSACFIRDCLSTLLYALVGVVVGFLCLYESFHCCDCLLNKLIEIPLGWSGRKISADVLTRAAIIRLLQKRARRPLAMLTKRIPLTLRGSMSSHFPIGGNYAIAYLKDRKKKKANRRETIKFQVQTVLKWMKLHVIWKFQLQRTTKLLLF